METRLRVLDDLDYRHEARAIIRAGDEGLLRQMGQFGLTVDLCCVLGQCQLRRQSELSPRLFGRPLLALAAWGDPARDW